jgi:hypothetical protein
MMNTFLVIIAMWLAPALLLGAFMLFSLRRDAAKRAQVPLSEYASNDEPAESAEGAHSHVPVSAALLEDVRVGAKLHAVP